jgi:hypothetical protein
MSKNYNKKAVYLILVFIILVFCVFLFIGFHNVKKESNRREYIKDNFQGINFSGHIDRVQSINRWGREYGLICLIIDYSSVDSFYLFNKYACLKIDNNIATLPIGFIGNKSGRKTEFILRANYVKVNLELDGNTCFYDASGDVMCMESFFQSNNLIESDMRLCN